MKKPFLPVTFDQVWRNLHDTTGVGGRAQRFYTPHNVWTDGTSARKRFQPGLLGLSTIVQEAEANGKRVRAIGSGWSLSPVAFTDEYLVNTSRLTYMFIGFTTPTMVEPPFRAPDRLKNLVFAQCGVQIRTLNTLLEAQDLALPTSGASNGQTIAGAISTGTHGSNRLSGCGGMPDCILGLHVVAEGGKHYWIERKTKPVVTQEFCDWLGAEPRRDDDLFRAALVSFGSFGLIHAVLLEPCPIFVLDRYVTQCDYDVIKTAIRTLEMAGVPFPDDEEGEPFHFEVVVNPYRSKAGQGGAFLRAYYKREALKPLPAPSVGEEQLLVSDDLLSMLSFAVDTVPAAIPGAVQTILKESFKAPNGKTFITGTPGKMFGDSIPKPGGTSLEIGLRVDDTIGTAIDAVLDAVQKAPFGAPMAFRFVAPSDALLAFTHFEPFTCTIEIPGIDSTRARQGHENIWAALRDSGIPHTYHWGQALPLNPQWVRNGYGDRLEAWKKARRGFLSSAGRNMFANALVVRCGLSEP